jgi:hypothetical protein
MSSGGRRGIDLSGNVSMRIQNTSDAVYQKKVQLIYTTNNAISNAGIPAWTGRNAYQSHTPNGNGYVRQFLNGLRECDCSGGFPGMTNGNITSFS